MSENDDLTGLAPAGDGDEVESTEEAGGTGSVSMPGAGSTAPQDPDDATGSGTPGAPAGS